MTEDLVAARSVHRHTVVVEGPLAFRTRRLRAARDSESGLQIMTLPLLAARLAGGFHRPTTRQDLDPAIRAALNAAGLKELEGIRTLPGMTRAVGRTLEKIWESDLQMSVIKGAGRPPLGLSRRLRPEFAPACSGGTQCRLICVTRR